MMSIIPGSLIPTSSTLVSCSAAAAALIIMIDVEDCVRPAQNNPCCIKDYIYGNCLQATDKPYSPKKDGNDITLLVFLFYPQ